jgi:hypothetical protein
MGCEIADGLTRYAWERGNAVEPISLEHCPYLESQQIHFPNPLKTNPAASLLAGEPKERCYRMTRNWIRSPEKPFTVGHYANSAQTCPTSPFAALRLGVTLLLSPGFVPPEIATMKFPFIPWSIRSSSTPTQSWNRSALR